MSPEQKYVANLAIDRWCKDSTARQIVRYVMECELWGQDTINPTNAYLANKYGWTMNTIESAIKLAKKSQFITTTGARKTRRFELNVGFLKGKMAEIVAQKPLKNTTFDDVLPQQLPPNLPPQLPPVEPPLIISGYGLPTSQKDENEGDSNKNKNKNIGALEDELRVVEVSSSEEDAPPKKEKDVQAERAAKYWFAKCQEEIGQSPSGGIAKHLKVIKDARKSLSYPQIREMIDAWFENESQEPHEMIQITRCLSSFQIDKYLAENV